MDANAFLSGINDTKYLKHDGKPKSTWRLSHADTLGEARKIAIAAAGGTRLVNTIKSQDWDTTRWAAQSAPDAAEIKAELATSGEKAWSAVRNAIHAMIGAKELDTQHDAAVDAALAVRLILLKKLDFEKKAGLIRDANEKIWVWSKGYCVAACIDGTIYAYYAEKQPE